MANWRDSEKTILKLHYAKTGVFGCKPFLPGRTRPAILAQAKALGIKCDLTALPRHHVRPWAARDHLHPLVSEVFAKMKKQQLTLKAASLRSGVHVGAISGWARKNPSLPNFVAVANAVGFELCLKELEP